MGKPKTAAKPMIDLESVEAGEWRENVLRALSAAYRFTLRRGAAVDPDADTLITEIDDTGMARMRSRGAANG